MQKNRSKNLYWASNDNAVDNKYNLNNSGWNLFNTTADTSTDPTTYVVGTAITAHDTDASTEDYLYIKPTIQLVATQYTEEYDSFDNQYDKDADGVYSYTASEYDMVDLHKLIK